MGNYLHIVSTQPQGSLNLEGLLCLPQKKRLHPNANPSLSTCIECVPIGFGTHTSSL